MKFVLFTILICLYSFAGICQKFKCDTKISKENIQCFKEFNSAKSSGNFSNPDCINRKLSVSLHIVSRISNCMICPPLNEIYSAFNALEPIFSPICLSFQICKIDTIEGSFYFDDFDEKHALVNNLSLHYNNKHMINIYFIDTFSVGGFGGFATLPTTPYKEGHVAISYASINTTTFAHELGHYFGLLHTFYQPGQELANESNCSAAGDFICDTNADPDSTGRSTDENCVYNGNFIDPNGDYYTPPISNYMSYYVKCSCKFSQMQYAKMAHDFRFFYNEQLW